MHLPGRPTVAFFGIAVALILFSVLTEKWFVGEAGWRDGGTSIGLFSAD